MADKSDRLKTMVSTLKRLMNILDILNLEWPHSDRDLHIVTPALVFLEKKYSIKYETKSIHNGYYYLIKYKPKLLLISNFSGADVNNEIVKLSYNMGIKVVTLISEGNVKEQAIDQFLWGWNEDRVLYVDKMCLWSERIYNIFISKYPMIEKQLVVTGATGFDRYQLFKFKQRQVFLQENNLNYKKIIGIAAWGFCHLFGKYYADNEEVYLKNFGKEQIDMHRNDLFSLQKIYTTLIENNQDTLFILRWHPGTVDIRKNEFYELDKYKNVFISRKYEKNNQQISDLINISDLWIGYETTTALEAWLLNKKTFLINPTRSDFIRENVHKGSPIVKTAGEAQNLIDEFFAKGALKSFGQLQSFREKIIKAVIEYNDGKNHIRAAEVIIAELHKPKKKTSFNFYLYQSALKQVLKLILSNTVMQKRWPELNYKSNFAEPLQKKYRKAIDV